jgi:biopolymer transport protein ExbD/biopolymer transport protein TolR
MKRFSQRNSLVTLNEINITPLLDLAFVLLIIFIITRPLIEQNIDLQLPQTTGKPEARNIDRHDIRMVEINKNGEYWLQGRHLSLAQLEAELVRTHQQNPKLIVDIRADKRSGWGDGIAVINVCLRNNITQFTVRTAPTEHQ